MPQIKSKEEALQVLSGLEEKTLIRVAELSTNKKALGYFSNPFQYSVLKGFLK
ncbi:hypothetical protein [Tenacibaculum caenipelagi]|uniref:Uncharacterized protein n=1 Tax=Tenacibaculum caenipelagi TaxID=1325435 RepID=A0A4R6TD79_9FLAO|nr:hypothetical protein [Tenacibaculum caenipelagi]TDQ22750.1 hypothetical protein DFQ07_2768 [Tenacibaculum caenipelagi]